MSTQSQSKSQSQSQSQSLFLSLVKSYAKNHPWSLHYTVWTDLSPGFVHDRHVLAALPGLGATKRKRILSARPGSCVEILRISSSSILVVRRLKPEEIALIQERAQTEASLKQVRAEIAQVIPPDLKKKETALLKEQKKAKKDFDDLVESIKI